MCIYILIRIITDKNEKSKDINVLENTELHKAYANISIDKESDYQILDIRICRME